jgi:hypothetical protein
MDGWTERCPLHEAPAHLAPRNSSQNSQLSYRR